MPRIFLVVLFLTAFVAAEDEKCTCDEGNSSYESLGSPQRSPGDPSVCPVVRRGLEPKMWRPTKEHGGDHRMASMGSFLLRHAASWQIECSMCATWKRKRKEPIRERHAEAVKVAASQKKVGGKRIEVAMSPHYVIVMDHPRLKITTGGGGIRVAGQHELLHLHAQRAEIARIDWTKVFGEPREMRSLIVMTWSESTRRTFSQVHWGNANTNLLYGGGKGRLPGGAGNGFVISGRDDDALHFRSRHMVGHLCVSTYAGGGTSAKYLPQWIFRGAAHWLSKVHPRAKNYATFCAYEGVTVSGSGKRWDDKARKIAGKGPQRDPVEAMFQASTAKQMNYQLHVRAWSWFDVFAAEEKEPFVNFIRQLRSAKEARVAAKEAWGQAPEYVDDRWRERVLGKRGDVTVSNREKKNEVDIDEAGSRELRGIAREHDMQLLAGKIRGLERPQNVKTARLLVSMIDSRNSDRVREVIALVLSRTKDEEILTYLRTDGYRRAGRFGKATLCRVFGEIRHTDAVPVMRTALSDSFWLVQVNAARTLAQLGDTPSIKPIASMAATSGKPKVRIGAMDALALYGAASADTIQQWERNAMHSSWQVKVATCDAFRGIGSTNALDMLIGRIDSEGGRVHDAIRRAIKSLTGMEREWNREEWRKWWAHTKKFQNLDKKMREELKKKEEAPPPKKTPSRRTVSKKKTGPPTYYGIRVYARAVGYVIDVSASMGQGFRVSQSWQDRLGRKYTANTRMGVCKQELGFAIKELDPRTRINLVFFNNRVRIWKSAPVPAGSMGDSAVSAVKNQQPSGQTNYHDALKAIMGLTDGPSWREAFPDTPDTLFFLTDGTPTDGEITKADELLAWFNERNRFARLRVHVIAMGTTGIDIEFLRKLAETNDGKFLHLTGTH